MLTFAKPTGMLYVYGGEATLSAYICRSNPLVDEVYGVVFVNISLALNLQFLILYMLLILST